MRFVSLFVVFVCPLIAIAQDGDDLRLDLELEGDSTRCIRSTSIRRTRAIDDSTLAFYLPGNQVFLNFLPVRCPGMERHQRFAYETRDGRLCRMDRISVMFDLGGRDIGPPCALGNFFPADAESVELMFEAAESGGATSSVTAETVELPPLDEPAEGADAVDTETED